MDNKGNSKITDFETFWKIVIIVCLAVVAEGIIIWTATSDLAVNWTYDNVFVNRDKDQIALDNTATDEQQTDTASTAEEAAQ